GWVDAADERLALDIELHPRVAGSREEGVEVVPVRARVLCPREVLSRAVGLCGRELLVAPAGLHSMLAQDRESGGDGKQCRDDRHEEETPAHDLSFQEGRLRRYS